MALLTGMTADGVEVPVQVLPDGKLVAEGLEGKEGPPGAAAVIGGSASLPGLHLPNDVRTGLYSDAAETVGVSVAGIPRLWVNKSSLGIGGPYNAPNIRNYVSTPLTGTTSQKQFAVISPIKKDVISYSAGVESNANTEAASFNLSSYVHFIAAGMTLGAGSSIDTLCCFRASSTNNTAKSNVGFESAIPAGPNNFAFFASGAADSRFDSNSVLICPGHVEKARFDANGYLLLGRGAALPVTAAKLQISGTANLSVVAYNDNTAAIGAGLVPGDIYRKPDGTLMIAY